MNKIDPTGTSLLRARFLKEFKDRLDVLFDLIVEYLSKPITPFEMIANADITADLIRSFEEWLRNKINQTLTKEEAEVHWTNKHLSGVYEKAVNKAYSKVRKKPLRQKDIFDIGLREFKQGFSTQNQLKRIQLLFSKTHTDLKGITESMSSKISSIMAEGALSNQPRKEIIKRIQNEVKGVSLNRIKRLVNTEMVRVHAEATLDAYEKLGVSEIGVDVEWSTAGDRKVCPLCSALANTVISIEDARGMFPRHPNCRCSPIPTTKKPDNQRLKNRIRKSIEASLPSTISRSFESQKRNTKWVGKRLLRK